MLPGMGKMHPAQGEHPASALTPSRHLPEDPQPLCSSLALSSVLMSCTMLKLLRRAALLPAMVTHSWLHHVPATFTAQRKQKSFHLPQPRSIPSPSLAWEDPRVENLRSIHVLRGRGWRGQSNWGRNEHSKSQRHAAIVASTDGAKHRMRRRNPPKCVFSPQTAWWPLARARCGGRVPRASHPSHAAEHTPFFRDTHFQWSKQKQPCFAFRQHLPWASSAYGRAQSG